jgi:hypothetical protein
MHCFSIFVFYLFVVFSGIHAFPIEGSQPAPVTTLAKGVTPAPAKSYVPSTQSRQKQTNTPPTLAQFQTFFDQHKDKRSRLMFSSGLTEEEATRFATEHQRYTLPMVLGKKWEKFFITKEEDPKAHWNTWDEAFKGFWGPISKFFAEFAQGDALVYQTEATWKSPNSTSMWIMVEHPILTSRLGKSDGLKNIIRWCKNNDGTDEKLIQRIWV